MKFAALESGGMVAKSFALERDSLVEPPGLRPSQRFPAEKEMQANRYEKKHKEQEPCGSQTLPNIHANRDGEQHAIFDNAKPAGLRMQGDMFFFPVEFLEGHVVQLGATLIIQFLKRHRIKLAKSFFLCHSWFGQV